MAYVAGIDEAGYGPVMGPLVVTATVFSVDDARQDFWEKLTGLVDSRRVKNSDSLLINDSKKLFNSKTGLKKLETAVLAFLKLRDRDATDFRTLLTQLASPSSVELDDYPWYQGRNFSLPLDVEKDHVDFHVEKLSAEMDSRGIRFAGVRSFNFCKQFKAAHSRHLFIRQNKVDLLSFQNL